MNYFSKIQTLTLITLISLTGFISAMDTNTSEKSIIPRIIEREINMKLDQSSDDIDITGCYDPWKGDGQCDLINNKELCAWDEGDCSDQPQSCYYKTCDYWFNSGKYSCEELESELEYKKDEAERKGWFPDGKKYQSINELSRHIGSLKRLRIILMGKDESVY